MSENAMLKKFGRGITRAKMEGKGASLGKGMKQGGSVDDARDIGEAVGDKKLKVPEKMKAGGMVGGKPKEALGGKNMSEKSPWKAKTKMASGGPVISNNSKNKEPVPVGESQGDVRMKVPEKMKAGGMVGGKPKEALGGKNMSEKKPWGAQTKMKKGGGVKCMATGGMVQRGAGKAVRGKSFKGVY